MAEFIGEEVDFVVYSTYEVKHGALVSVRFDDQEVLISPEKAREMANMLLDAAQASLMDAFLFEWAEQQGDPEQNAPPGGIGAQVLKHFQEWCETREREHE